MNELNYTGKAKHLSMFKCLLSYQNIGKIQRQKQVAENRTMNKSKILENDIRKFRSCISGCPILASQYWANRPSKFSLGSRSAQNWAFIKQTREIFPRLHRGQPKFGLVSPGWRSVHFWTHKNWISLPRELKGRYAGCRILKKGAGANGYIQWFIHFRDYALRCYNSCFTHQKQKKIAPSAW